MRVFVWVVAITLAIDIFGKAAMIYQRDFQRKPGLMLADIIIGICMLAWATYLLGQSA